MGNTGEDSGAACAALTVTCFRKKPGHRLLPGRALCGEFVVADIGTPEAVFVSITPDTFENDPVAWVGSLPALRPDGNKYTRDHALFSVGYPTTGAARMSARAAARVGAGLTTIAVPEIAWSVCAAILTSVMVEAVSVPEEFDRLLGDRRYSAMLIGSGAGLVAASRAGVLAMLATGRPAVLDADALTSFQGDPDAVDRAIRGPCARTPHEGEFKRLFDSGGDKLTRARTAARRSGVIVVLKGSDTVIVAPGGAAIINSNASPTLATAGSGDMLSGMILGLPAQGMEALSAAAAAVWLHGAAAQAIGPRLLAEDLPDLLPGVLHGLLR
jgi:NAD(P)H-hydrate epimerase